VAVSGTANAGGLVEITTSAAHGLTTGDKVYITGLTGTPGANGGHLVTVTSTTTFTVPVSFVSADASGTVRTGYGWTITDGGQAP
jgi:hypothetical protein